MTLLTKAEIEERIALYQRYNVALDKLLELDAALPADPPPDLLVSWAGGSAAKSQDRVSAVVYRAWSALRDATLRDMHIEVEAAEAAVRAFEHGEEVNDAERSDGPVGGAVAGDIPRQGE